MHEEQREATEWLEHVDCTISVAISGRWESVVVGDRLDFIAEREIAVWASFQVPLYRAKYFNATLENFRDVESHT
jgi:hypothetical protein